LQPQQRDSAVSLGSVDVLMAAWNCSNTIERAIMAALSEPEVARVIVVDDASTDDTVECVARIDAPPGRVLVEKLLSNGGPAVARNVALRLSTAPWVCVLDSDDFWLPGRMRTLLRYADRFDFIADDLLQVPADEVECQVPAPMLDEQHEGRILDFATFVRGNISRPRRVRRELGFLKPLMRRSFLDAHGLRYDERIRFGVEDYVLYARALALGARFLLLPPAGYVSVVRPDSLSSTHTRQDLKFFQDVDLELAAIDGLSSHDRRALNDHHASIEARIQWRTMIDAYKKRSVIKFLAPFFRSEYRVSYFLMMRLLSESLQRLWPSAGHVRVGGGAAR
jgi:succinoglycan biosynthesis protein ExoU